MSRRGAWRFRSWVVYVLLPVALLAVAGLAWWLLAPQPWPWAASQAPTATRLQHNAAELDEYRQRIEAKMRLELLGSSMDDGRRSTALRPSHRLIEDLVEDVALTLPAADAARLTAELEGMLADLSRNRSEARSRIDRMIELLESPAGPGRQGM